MTPWEGGLLANSTARPMIFCRLNLGLREQAPSHGGVARRSCANDLTNLIAQATTALKPLS